LAKGSGALYSKVSLRLPVSPVISLKLHHKGMRIRASRFLALQHMCIGDSLRAINRKYETGVVFPKAERLGANFNIPPIIFRASVLKVPFGFAIMFFPFLIAHK